MRLSRLHVRVLVPALVALVVAPTLGRTGLDRVRARAAVTEAAHVAAAPADAPAPAEPDGPDAAPVTDGGGDREPAEPTTPASETTPESAAAPAESSAPAGDDAPAADAPAEADAPPEPEPAEAPAVADPAPATTADATPLPDVTLAVPSPQTRAEKRAPRKAAAAAPATKQAEPKGRVRSLYLAIGHGTAPDGTFQPGAEHPDTGQFEVDAAATMVAAMAEELAGAPNLKLTTETADDNPNLIGSVERANALGVDDCISIHQDTAAAPPGAFVHWYTGKADAKGLADRIVEGVQARGVPIRWDWHRERPGLYFLRTSTCRSVLAEVGRVGDFDDDELRELGRSIARSYLADTAQARGVAQ